MSHQDNDVTAHNRETWDSKAKDYDAKPWQKKIAAQVASALDSHSSWLGANWTSSSNKECKLLDYACGTGSVTRALSNHITHATGLDISSQMLEQYKTLLSSSHPSLSLTTAIADFCSEDPDPCLQGPEFYDFDVAGVALGFHHFNNPGLCISNLAKRLKKGGVLFIVDWLPKDVKPEDHIGHQHAHPTSSDTKEGNDTEEWKKMQKTIKTNGFTEEDMRTFFEGAGFQDFGFVVLEESFVLQMNGKEVKKTGFIAKGRKV
ncbi:S-adenosyl-L-methionine-dependent methyltransferase [Aureobasidium melanogenum CBS 110374]|uniref:S-adenosyl-L-methionine-dependent methyltransferase n=1 Tax=Aureobasidium melanogenum (strain CBS 110374) TaxID=1043003 RepID=A0A074VGG0_AURM1|nr:S-adenosyl-L-methionine-dependent methyltransferase [Aureobasidium melanogenum CBS 110374]KEQ59558.1 S-adenosyl-L-methionine-dependent methyltransferase [Aureobasidium melanogenum CBS 110374]